jgi:cytochrome oxidase Cu insertion factor (SCO1/SenC/PrrC family)
VLALLLAAAIRQRTRPTQAALEVFGEVPEFSFLNERGEPVTKSTFGGTLWVADFIFTRCGGQCPRMTAAMRELQRWLNKQKIDDVLLFSLSVDPEHDTTATLQDYALRYDYDPWRWSFCTGDKATIYKFIRGGFKLGVEDQPAPGAAPDNEPIIHSSKFVLIDRRGRIRGYYDGLDSNEIKKLQEAILALRKEKSAG